VIERRVKREIKVGSKKQRLNERMVEIIAICLHELNATSCQCQPVSTKLKTEKRIKLRIKLRYNSSGAFRMVLN
jgi:hypothetical protein